VLLEIRVHKEPMEKMDLKVMLVSPD